MTEHLAQPADARAWIESLPSTVEAQASVLLRLLEAAEAEPRIRALQIRGSIAHRTADEHSDLDTLVRISDDRYEATLADMPSLVRSIGPTLDVLFETPGSPYLFVQYADGVQLELACRRASEAGGLGPGVVALLDRDGLLRDPVEPEAAWDEELWLGWAWMALSDADKYLRRGSVWEALAAVEKARSLLLRHHAAAAGSGGALPDRLQETVAQLDPGSIRRAAYACAEILGGYEQRPFAELVLARLRPG